MYKRQDLTIKGLNESSGYENSDTELCMCGDIQKYLKFRNPAFKVTSPI